MMKTDREMLAGAYGEVIDAEFLEALAEAEAEPHRFSNRFEKKMRSVLGGRPASGKASPARSRRTRRIVLIAAAVILALAAIACAVPKIRNSIAGFFIRDYSNHSEFYLPKPSKTSIEEEYAIFPVPEGYELVDYSPNANCVHLEYENKKEKKDISLYQFAHDPSDTLSFDNEHGEPFECDIAGKTVYIQPAHDGYYIAGWIENGYLFAILVSNVTDFSELEAIISSVRLK